MRSITVQERIDDIVKRSGLSESIVRRVLNAERESILESLKRGERATLIGRCTIVPDISYKIGVGGVKKVVVKLRASASYSLETELAEAVDAAELEKKIDKVEKEEGIMVRQIPGLL